MPWLTGVLIWSLLVFPMGEPPQLRATARLAAMEPGTRAEHEALLGAFFAAIDEARVAEAIGMLRPELVAGAARTDWENQFQAIVSVVVVAMEPTGDLTGPCYGYKVTLRTAMSPESADAPIPYFGWDDNPNVRWISLCPGDGRAWQISAIGTGP